MSNYRDGAMIDIIGKMDSPLLGVHKNRCVLVRNRNAECLRCASVCTTGAISIADGDIVVDLDACIGCGTCASACPTCCLEARNPDDEELFGRMSDALAASGGKCAFACESALGVCEDVHRAWHLEDGTPIVSVVCLGRIEESILLQAAALGAQSVFCLHANCALCTRVSGSDLHAHACADVRELLDVANANMSIAELDVSQVHLVYEVTDDTDVIEHMRERDTAEPQEERTVSDESPDILEGVRQHLQVHGTFAHVQADGTLAHHIPQRRARIFNSIKRLGVTPGSRIRTELWGHVSVDTELCRSCRMCTVFCPTGALSRFDEEQGAFGVEHRQALCVQCGTCAAICPEQAITLEDEVELADVLTGHVEHIGMRPVGWHPGAEDAIATHVARFLDVDILQDMQGKTKPEELVECRRYARQRQERRDEIRASRK